MNCDYARLVRLSSDLEGALLFSNQLRKSKGPQMQAVTASALALSNLLRGDRVAPGIDLGLVSLRNFCGAQQARIVAIPTSDARKAAAALERARDALTYFLG